MVPSHFHVTEMGIVHKNYIDCGHTTRSERSATFQLWVANDTEHRLTPQKFLGIIALGEGMYGVHELDVVVEYQQETIGVFGLELHNGHFRLTAKHTACLAEDACKIPQAKSEERHVSKEKQTCCTPGGGCC
jgi:hypothetical protein